MASLLNLRMHTLWHRYTHHYCKEDLRISLMIHQRNNEFIQKRSSPEEIEKIVRRHIKVALKPFLAAVEKLEEKIPRWCSLV